MFEHLMKKVLLITLFACLQINAQQIRFENLENQSGISLERIKSINQDRQGFVWLASINDLWRYDGYELKRFNNEIKQITNEPLTDITDLAIDSNNRLWISTRFNGLFMYDSLNSKNFKICSMGFYLRPYP